MLNSITPQDQGSFISMRCGVFIEQVGDFCELFHLHKQPVHLLADISDPGKVMAIM